MAQPLWADMFSLLRGPPGRAVFNFGHSETLQPVVAGLGLFRDKWRLQARDWGTVRQRHVWAASHLAPFAANVAVVRWHCELGGTKVK